MQQQVADAHRVRAEQVGLHAEQVPVAAGVLQDRLDAGVLLESAPPVTARSSARRSADHRES